MKELKELLVKNWLTTLGGLLAGVPQLMQYIPDLILGSGFHISDNSQHWLNLMSGLGAIILGVSAKQFNTHSTIAQVNKATAVQIVEGAKAENVKALDVASK